MGGRETLYTNGKDQQTVPLDDWEVVAGAHPAPTLQLGSAPTPAPVLAPTPAPSPERERKCCRCMTMEPMPSNQKHGCLFEIYKGEPCDAACKTRDVSSGRYPSDGWLFFGSGTKNYKFTGKCSEAAQKGGDTFTQHEMCPTH